MHNYPGNIHIHSKYSDGTGTIPEIAEAANKAGLDFIIITDHDTREGVREEGIFGRTVVIVGTELNSGANHFLAMGTTEDIEDYTDDPQKTIDEVNRQKGFGILAHPFETGSPLITDGAAIPWTDLSVNDFGGLELWNYCSQWKGESLSVGKILYWYLFDRDGPVKQGPSVECMKFWDEQTQKRPVVGIGGTDAHAIDVRLGFIKLVVFPYEDLFRTINTHVLLQEELSKNFCEAKEQILDALRQGRCYVCFDRYKADNAFYFGAFNEEEEVPMGSEIEFREGIYLKIFSPGKNSLVRIIKNGKLVLESKDRNLIFNVLKKGTFRVEIYFCPRWGRPRPWIFSNPVYVK